jgi:hypothetical protein
VVRSIVRAFAGMLANVLHGGTVLVQWDLTPAR